MGARSLFCKPHSHNFSCSILDLIFNLKALLNKSFSQHGRGNLRLKFAI
jgi:hypothetical protein